MHGAKVRTCSFVIQSLPGYLIYFLRYTFILLDLYNSFILAIFLHYSIHGKLCLGRTGSRIVGLLGPEWSG